MEQSLCDVHFSFEGPLLCDIMSASEHLVFMQCIYVIYSI